MKTLTLLRHAKSGWDDLALRDFDRPLNAKGKRAGTAMGRHMRAAGLGFDHAVASPAVRVRETIEAVAAGYGALEPVFDKRIYLASAATLIEVIRELPDTAGAALLIGHNPGLEDLVLLLAADDDSAARCAAEAKYPTATVAQLAFDVAHWADVADGGARLVLFVRPRDIDATLGPDTD